MKNFFHTVFIKSWKTTLGGAALVVSGVTGIPMVSETADTIVQQNPQTKADWIRTLVTIGAGIGLMFAKDGNVTGGTK